MIFCVTSFSTTSRDSELLKATVHPKIYRAAKEACQIILEKKQKFILKDVRINDFKIVSVNVEVVDENIFETQQIEEEEISLSSFSVPSTDDSDSVGQKKGDITNETIKSKADSDMPESIKYPLGSVLANVVVYYESEDIYEVVSKEPLQGDVNFQEFELSNTKRNFWSFSACISGHVDLNWQVVRI